MPWIYGILFGLAAGVASGALAERLPIPPILQTVGAALVAMVLAFVGMLILSMRLPPRGGSGGVGAVSAGLPEVILFLLVPGFIVAVAGLHYALGRVGPSMSWIAQHRAIVLACVGGLCGAMPMAWMMAAMSRAFGTE